MDSARTFRVVPSITGLASESAGWLDRRSTPVLLGASAVAVLLVLASLAAVVRRHPTARRTAWPGCRTTSSRSGKASAMVVERGAWTRRDGSVHAVEGDAGGPALGHLRPVDPMAPCW